MGKYLCQHQYICDKLISALNPILILITFVVFNCVLSSCNHCEVVISEWLISEKSDKKVQVGDLKRQKLKFHLQL